MHTTTFTPPIRCSIPSFLKGLCLSLLFTFTPNTSAFASAPGSIANAQTIVQGLSEPLSIATHPNLPDRIYIAEKAGRVKLLTVSGTPANPQYTLQPTPVLDISSITYPPGNRGMLGLALAPDHDTSGIFYVYHTTNSAGPEQAVLARYTLNPATPGSPVTANPNSRQPLLTVPTGLYHHGGAIAFGVPPDNNLYLARGDEGFDQLLARNPGVLTGKILRIDVTTPPPQGRTYVIPQDNPFARTPGGLPEVWSSGLRSPWRFSFDRATADLWIGDVGEASFEEITFLPRTSSFPAGRSADLGWPAFEGNARGPAWTPNIDPSRVTFPILDYPHEPNLTNPPTPVERTGCSVSGGVVYRGVALPQLNGRYFWSDFCNTRVFSALRSGNTLIDITDHSQDLLTDANGAGSVPFGPIASFGEDAQGEVYIVEIYPGRIRKIVPDNEPLRSGDIASAGPAEGPDGIIDNNDFILFVTWFFNGDPRADFGIQGGIPGSDGQLNSNDFVSFIAACFPVP